VRGTHKPNGPRDGWAEFRRRFPAQRGFIRVTPVAYSSDSLDALVYYEFYCGSLCGGGVVVSLTRREPAKRWKPRVTLFIWES
jgi:hypothetical protein